MWKCFKARHVTNSRTFDAARFDGNVYNPLFAALKLPHIHENGQGVLLLPPREGAATPRKLRNGQWFMRNLQTGYVAAFSDKIMQSEFEPIEQEKE